MPAAIDRIGQTLAGKYELLKVLGRGGMGIVYEARNAMTGRHVAVKVLSGETPDENARHRLLREARAAATLRHAHVVDMIDVVVDADVGALLVMELLVGESLEKLLARRGPLSFEEAVAFLGPVADALQAAHDAGIVHRDFKPSNIFLHADAQGRIVPKLVDFGIAWAGTARVTSTGVALGTVGYMAPEQMSDGRAADHRSDIWAFAVVVYECLAGALPFSGETPVETIASILGHELTPLDVAAPGISRDIGNAVHRGLSLRPEDRPSSVSELARSLGFGPETGARARATEIAPALPSRPNPSRPARRRPPGLRVALSIGAAAALLVAAFWWWGRAPAVRLSRLSEVSSGKLPEVILQSIAGGIIRVGSTAEEMRAARNWCGDEVDAAQCPVEAFTREGPVATVEVAPFRLSTHEVTNLEFVTWVSGQKEMQIESSSDGMWIRDAGGRLAALAGDNRPHSGLIVTGDRLVLRNGFADRPAVWVTHRAASSFCRGLAMRLPTQTEWEAAASGTAQRRFPWGNALFGCHRAVAARGHGLACANGAEGPASVFESMQDATADGVTGLGGNVAEWTADEAPASWGATHGACEHDCFVVKGGDWASPAWLTRNAARRAMPENGPADWLGWRCAAGPSSP